MSSEILLLAVTAISIGFLHTLIGPDHYVPFVMMAKARQWSRMKTIAITFVCGIGHILSSIILGLVGIAVGIAVSKLEMVESVRGEIASWLLIGFGLVYFIWGLHRAYVNRPHRHIHEHSRENEHEHEHAHIEEHVHIHEHGNAKTVSLTPWILFTIFIFGPCEPLIPLLMYPAAKHSIFGVILVTVAFGLTTILTMIGIVLIVGSGISLLPVERFERYMHSLAGLTIVLCGLGVKVLGL
jgi:sulfite exporter TauE/SafE